MSISGWLFGQRRRVRRRRKPARRQVGRAEYLKHREAARALVATRIEALNAVYGFSYGKVAIRNQRSRWGSCSKKGNLNFNYRIVLLSPQLADYIIVHELCHLKEFNHSNNFWNLVAVACPEYATLRAELKKIRIR